MRAFIVFSMILGASFTLYWWSDSNPSAPLSKETVQRTIAIQSAQPTQRVAEPRVSRPPSSNPVTDQHPRSLRSLSWDLLKSLDRKAIDPALVKETSRKILEVNPNDVKAREYDLQASYMKYRMSGTLTSVESELEQSLREYDLLHPGSAKVAEMRMNIARNRGETALMRTLAAEAAANPNTKGLGEYYLAWAAHLDRDSAASLQHLSAIEPNDPQFAVAAEALEDLKAGEMPLFVDTSGGFTYTILAPAKE